MNAKINSVVTTRDALTRLRPQYPVLVIDDDPVFRSLISGYLEGSGYPVTHCERAEDALLLINRASYPLVVCDWLLPGLSGLDLCQQIREQNQIYRYFILMTSKSKDEDLYHGFQAGADDYIRKGARKQEILSRLDAGLRVLVQQDELVRQRAEIERFAVTDPLTECFNRRYLMELGVKEAKRANRYRQPLSLVMCDLDFFKQINDRYGHQAGDKVLQACAQAMMERLRQDVDIVCRIGGEEFVIVLPNTNEQQASQVAEKLRFAISSLALEWDENTINVTASFGVAVSQPHSPYTIDELISQADVCLYQSKQSGRNKVTS